MALKDFIIARGNDQSVREQITSFLNQIWTDAVALFTAAAYGGIQLLTPDATFPDIGVTWETVRYDTGSLTTPRGVTQDFANNGLRFEVSGVFLLTLGVTFGFTETQAGRNIQIRIYNATTATGGQATLIAIGRNQDGLNFSTAILTEISDLQIGDLIQIQVSALTAGDTLSNVTEVSASFNANSVSEYRGT